MNIVTRFAPSPTGFLHIGGARTALFNYLFAKNNGGKFLLRIEDTDKNRSTDEAKQAILDGLHWLGLKNDDEIVFQSKNQKRHQEIALKLLGEGKAYYCYTSAEELAESRQAAEAKGEVFRFQSPWRDSKEKPETDVKPVIRIKAPREGQTIVHDLVRGEIKVENSELDDLVILRGDETPTYMLAVVVDDHDMKVSHIIRGEDHLTNTFRQKIIYDALKWDVPNFAHVPLIHGPDGAKMSKRHGATSVIDYKQMGYLPEAMRNYLLRLGWSHGDDEIISDANAIKWFDLEHIGKSPARFDFDKLNNLNKHYIKEKSNQELFNLIEPSLRGAEGDAANQGRHCEVAIATVANQKKITKALAFIKERSANIGDLINACEIYLDGFTKNLSQQDAQIISENKNLILQLKAVIEKIDNFTHDGIKDAINEFATQNNLKFKDFGKPLRIALTFSSSSAGGIFDIIEILGKDETLKRIS